MGNKWINQYIRRVRSLFPVLRKPEKAYLRQLRANINDYYQENPPDSIEMICSVFGDPEDSVGEYLETVNADEMIQKMKYARNWRIAEYGLLVVILVATLIFSIRLQKDYSDYLDLLAGGFGYYIETIE